MSKQGSKLVRKSSKVRALSGDKTETKLAKAMAKTDSITGSAASHNKIKNFLNKLEENLELEAMDAGKPGGLKRLESVHPVMKPSEKSATLRYGDLVHEIPIIVGTSGAE